MEALLHPIAVITRLTWVCIFTVMTVVITAQEAGPKQTYPVSEQLPVGTFIGNVFINSDLESKYDSFQLASLRFQFLSEPDFPISVEADTGVLRTSEVIDREILCPSRIIPVCSDNVDVIALIPDPMTILEIIKVAIIITDINDNTPTFYPETHVSKQISESTVIDSSFVLPSAVDLDSGVNGIKEYVLQGGDGKFDLVDIRKVDGSVELKLVLKESLDHEIVSHYNLVVVAVDGGTPPRNGTLNVDITVLDANDNDPRFDNSTYEKTVAEGAEIHTPLVQVHATDQDSGMFGKVTYGFSTNTQTNYGNIFEIDNITGIVRTRGEINYEDAPVYHLTVTAKDQDPDSIPVEATVIINIQDINDNAPQITVSTITNSGLDTAEISENAEINAFVAYVTVVDQDTGINGEFDCTLNDNHFRMEQLYETEYKIVTQALLDREVQAYYNLAVMCEDHGMDPQRTIKNIRVNVGDVNDNGPVFNPSTYVATTNEDVALWTILTDINATDADTGRNGLVSYYLLPPEMTTLFDLDPGTGIIRSKTRYDFENRTRYEFQVVAKDNGFPSHSASAMVMVNIRDVNDEVPVFSQDTYSFGVLENKPIGTSVGVVHAEDGDSEPFNEFEFSLLPSYAAANKFTIDALTGEISTQEVLDREEQAVYYLVVMASDPNIPSLSGTASVSIYVTDTNDNAPLFEYPSEYNNTLYISNAVPPGYMITRVKALDQDISDNANLTYHIASGNQLALFSMDHAKGTLVVNKELHEIDYQVFNMVILVRDQGIPEQTATTNLNVVVNKSLVYQQTSGEPLGYNFTIVVSMATVSAVVVVILIIAIVLLRRQDRDDDHRKYIEASKIVITASVDNKDIRTDDEDPDTPKHHGDPRSPRELPLRLPPRIPSVCERVPSKNSSPAPRGGSTPAHACALQVTTTTTSPRHPLQAPGQHHQQILPPPPSSQQQQQQQQQHKQHQQQLAANSSTAPWALTQNELQVHRFLNTMKVDGDGEIDDGESASSEEGSHADSGKGPSESGEQPQQAGHIHPIPAPPGRPPTYPQPPRAPSRGQASMPSYATQNPKFRTFTGSNSNTSADSGFRDGSDKDTSDADADPLGSLKLRLGHNPYQQKPNLYHPLPPRVPLDSANRHPAYRLPPEPPDSYRQSNGGHRDGMMSPRHNPLKDNAMPDRNGNPQRLGSHGTCKVAPRGQPEALYMNDLNRRKDANYMLNLRDANIGDMCSDVVV